MKEAKFTVDVYASNQNTWYVPEKAVITIRYTTYVRIKTLVEAAKKYSCICESTVRNGVIRIFEEDPETEGLGKELDSEHVRLRVAETWFEFAGYLTDPRDNWTTHEIYYDELKEAFQTK